MYMCWGGLNADTENEMEHVAYREISTECSLMNTPLYLCYNGKRRLYDVPTPTHRHTHTPLPSSMSFPWKQRM